MSNSDYFSLLQKDIRFREGLNACIDCGTCTAICPAAQFYDYDPRIITDTVQTRDNNKIEELLKSDTIWYCGECLSCKTRCPRGNTPGYIIQALRALSVETGLFAESEKGRQQLAIKRTVGESILKFGYCVYIDDVDTQMYPEQGPVWDWLKNNREKMLERTGTNYKGNGSGTLRLIPEESLADLKKIFDATGASQRFEIIEKYSEEKAKQLGIPFGKGKDNEYFESVYEGGIEDE